MILNDRIVELLGGTATLGRSISSVSELELTVAEGLPKNALRHVIHHIFPERSAARRALYSVVPEATYKRRTKLSSEESGKTERLARVIAVAEYTWDDRENARKWLMLPHAELDGKTPLDVGKSELGARRVEDLLARLFYGIPA